ncbi:MAG: HAD hydrolase-like protein [Lachnospiraceae bacterium]|nr:HAD hydrolase-like protein [Lachnospiraceae bacterium]
MKTATGKFQYLLFDLDGTLTDPKLGIARCLQYALHKLGIEETDLDKFDPFIGPPLQESFKEFYGFDEKKIAEAVAYYRERFSDVGLYENEIYPGMEEMLAHLKREGKLLAIASSKTTIYVKRILQYFNIEQYFDVVVGSEMDGTRNKKEEVVEEALRQLKLYAVEESDCDTFVMIGDRKFDINAAKAFGIASIGVSYGYPAPGELEQAGADYIVDTVQELEKLLVG